MLETIVFSPSYLLRMTVAIIVTLLALEVGKMIHATKFHVLRKVPGPWFPAASSLWIRWQRWHGRLSFTADNLLSRYGPIVRISPNMVLINDPQAVQSIFARQDLDTAPRAIRALRIGGHEWTVTYPQNDIARERRRPVMVATTNMAMRYWQPIFEANIMNMISNLASSQGNKSEDIVHHLRVATLLNSEAVMAGSHAKIEPGNFPHIVGEYNFLVVWRLCLPEWLFSWMKLGPFSHSRFRVRSSDLLFKLGEEICRQADQSDPADRDDVPTVYQLLMEKQEKGVNWSHDEISAEMAGQILAATETTSSALAFIFYELAKNPGLAESVNKELQTVDGYSALDNLKLLNACISEGLRFRPPVALTGSRVIPKGGMDILGYYIPEGTVVTTQSLSLSRQRPDLFPNYDVFDPTRWLDEEKLAERRRCTAPFGVGSRRCPGGNMAIYQMRLILAAVVHEFNISVAPETTPDSMRPFEANGFRSRYDECYLFFTPRGAEPAYLDGKEYGDLLI
ncbi:cytochrome p450 monooxygenase [Moniliophthora roreri MCA 2997]|uniref:Cytochrome p450 monooxygenase n=2 Tax=Moniliophthora roreri TaxID=221103 RepID=V2WUR6_MONRO|nr:cytochrome p450 monooxygenase [Moniliophthora roreri MCA 2997]KAI3616028.1 cytochrome p450 monooxygenase [Moniliophthora roreri]